MKTLHVNGTQVQSEHETLAQLIDHYELNKEHVVAEVNGQIVDRRQWTSYPLQDGAQVELVHFVGGG